MEERSITVKSILSQCQYQNMGSGRIPGKPPGRKGNVWTAVQDQRAERPGWKYGDACRSVDGSSGRGAVTGRFQCGQCRQKRKQNHAEI